MTLLNICIILGFNALVVCLLILLAVWLVSGD